MNVARAGPGARPARRAMVSIVEETVWTWFIAEAKPAIRSPN